MKLIVNPHKIEIIKEPVNEREINISKCEFIFAEEITEDFVKEAYFTLDNNTYKQIIINNECDIPSEVLIKKGTVEIGVVAYLIENEEEIKRYNPSPAYLNTWVGSLKDNVENIEPITPTDKEQIEQAITNLQNDVDDLDETKQDKLISGENIKTINGESVLGEGNIEVVTDLSDYYTKKEVDQSQASQNENIQANAGDISDIKSEQITQNAQIGQNKTDIETLAGELIKYSLITETGSQIALNINSSTYQLTAVLKDKNGNIIYTSNVIDLPIESMIINVDYDSTTKEIVFTLQNGNTLRVSVADLVSGLVSTDDLTTILANYYTKAEIDILLNGKQNILTFDNTPTENSTNPVTSGGIYNSQVEQNTQLTSLNSLVDQLPVVSGTGTNISLQDVLNYRFRKLDIFGNASQKNNLFNNDIVQGAISEGVDVSATNRIRTNGYIEVIPNTSVLIDFTGCDEWFVSYYDNSKTYGGAYGWQAKGNSVPIPSNVYYIRIAFRKSDNSNITPNSISNVKVGDIPNPSYPQSIKVVTGENSLIISNSDNTQSQTYPLSLGNIELAKIPNTDYEDYIYGTPNNWYKKQVVGKITLNSESNWKFSNGVAYMNSGVFPINYVLNQSIYCNYYGYGGTATNTSSAYLNGNNKISLNTADGTSIYIRNDNITSASDFKTWLSNNSTTIYYVLATPQDIPITDTTLIGQLNNIYNNAYSYNGVTNISSSCESGNEQMIFEASALLDLNSLVTRIQLIESEV